ncbi:hypothetical protein [Kingella oralis]|jgi:hypothetical protein|uniref:hypothetical protein n=1 Tax=Kingella oralis TaxID=505 RepID=UPI0034E55F22
MFTLILPALLREPHETLPELHTPALNQLLRYARVQPTAYSRMQLYQTYLCDQLGQPENIIYASPVWQQMGMNTASQIPAEHLPLTHSEATIWCNELNQFYHGEYLFTPIRPDLWTLALPSPPTWHAPSILDLTSQLDGSQTASGSDIRPWLALSTELQMWLHNHPRNAARQQNQLPPINGIWLWNAPAAVPFQAASLIASNSAWAAHSSQATTEQPENYAAWQRTCAQRQIPLAHTHIFADDFLPSQQTGDIWAYQTQLAVWEQNWFEPLRQDLLSGCLKGLRIVCEQAQCTIGSKPQRAFWKRKRRFDGKTL